MPEFIHKTIGIFEHLGETVHGKTAFSDGTSATLRFGYAKIYAFSRQARDVSLPVFCRDAVGEGGERIPYGNVYSRHGADETYKLEKQRRYACYIRKEK